MVADQHNDKYTFKEAFIMNKQQERIEKIFDFLQIVENLKSVTRYSMTRTGRIESTAEHTWRLALMSFIFSEEVAPTVDRLKVIKMALVHDIAEAITGDIDALKVANGTVSKEEKHNAEVKAMEKIRESLPRRLGDEIFTLWEEYETHSTTESRFVRALDKIETTTQLVEIGHKKWDVPDFIPKYPDKTVKEFPPLIPTLKILKARLKKEFEAGNLEWKKEYEVQG